MRYGEDAQELGDVRSGSDNPNGSPGRAALGPRCAQGLSGAGMR